MWIGSYVGHLFPHAPQWFESLWRSVSHLYAGLPSALHVAKGAGHSVAMHSSSRPLSAETDGLPASGVVRGGTTCAPASSSKPRPSEIGSAHDCTAMLTR